MDKATHFARVGPRRVPPATITVRWGKGPMPAPYVLLLMPIEGGVLVCGYAADGTFAGDTWHWDADDAMEAYEAAAGVPRSAWRGVPDGVAVDDAVAWCVRKA